jgi:hypothetical protein
VKEIAEKRAAEIEEAWKRMPLRVSVRGDLPSRTQLFTAIIGERLNAVARVPLRVRRGPQARFRAKRGAKIEEHEKPAPLPPPEVEPAAVAPVMTPAAPAKPPWWAFWLWIWWWLQREVRKRRALGEAVAAVEGEHVDRRNRARAEAEANVASYPARINELLADSRVDELTIDVAEGQLTPDVELVELGDGPASSTIDMVEIANTSTSMVIELAEGPTSAIDLAVAVERRVVFAVDQPDEWDRRLGSIESAPAAFPVFARRTRACRIGWSAIELLHTIEATLSSEITEANRRFRDRITALEMQHVDDRNSFAAKDLAALSSEVISRSTGIVKHVLAHVGSELDRILDTWTREITETTTIEDLQALATRIDDELPPSIDELTQDSRRLLASSLAGCVHDLKPTAIARLVRSHGLPPERVHDVVPPSIAILGKLLESNTPLGTVTGNWLGNLFKSFDARRSEVFAKMKQRIKQLHDLASAELLDLEPQLHTTLTESLASLLASAFDAQATALAEQIAAEQVAITRDREALAPLNRARDGAHDNARKLATAIADLTAQA